MTTPEHDPGTVTVTIDWTRLGAVQTPDTGSQYEFQHIGVLPQAGGEGILTRKRNTGTFHRQATLADWR